MRLPRSIIRRPQKLGIFKRFYLRLSLAEKAILIICSSLIVLYSATIVTKFVIDKALNSAFSTNGYIEGIVAHSRADIDPVVDRLTKIGLVDFDDEGEIIPAAASSWDIQDEGKKYTFALNPQIKQTDIDLAIGRYSNLFAETKISSSENELTFELEQSFSPFLNSLSLPIFNYGAYKVKKEDKNYIKMVPREEPLAKEAQLAEVILKIYPDYFSLAEALQKNEIHGVASTANLDPTLLENMNTYTVELPRKIYLFFNSQNEELNLATRQALAEGKNLQKEIDIQLVTLGSETHARLADNIQKLWEPLGANVEIITASAGELATSIIPARQYDALIYGIDLGYGLDFYPFWHSSQISEKGLNLANFANVDADKILENARQTIDSEKRQELNQQFEELLAKEVPAIELQDTNWEFAVNKDIFGITSHAGYTSADRFRLIANWYR